jgi:serine/threonine-protein kinase RsbW
MLGTERSAVLMAAGDELRCEASVGWPEPMERVPLDSRSHVAHVCLTQEVAIVPDLAADDRFPASQLPLREGIASAAATPIRGGHERALGVLAVHAAAPRTFTEEDVLYLRSLANVLAAAIAHGRAENAISRLQAATAALAEARTPREIADAIVSSGAASVGAAGGWVAEVSRDGTRLELMASLGYDTRKAGAYRSLDLDASNPTTDALSRQEPLFFRSAAEVHLAYPELRYLRFEAMVVVPVIIGSEPIGVFALNFEEPRAFDVEEKRQLDALAKLYAQSLERALLYLDSQRRERASSVVARLSESLERATTVTERCRRAASILVSEIATSAAIDLQDESGQLSRVSFSRSEPAAAPPAGFEAPLAARAIETGEAQSAPLQDHSEDRPSMLHVLPLQARRRTSGVLVVTIPPERSREEAVEPEWLREVANHIAVGLDNARLFEREQGASRTLQLGLLGGELPNLPSAELAAAYRPGTVTNEVGGDWYDSFSLPHGKLALLVGDVVGHDLDAAVAMGQLRGAVGALAPLGSPAELLDRLDRFVRTVRDGDMTTLAYLELDPPEREVCYACAGHPPPLVISEDGSPRFLWGGRSGPLGVETQVPRIEDRDRLAPGDTVVLYTDGLIERKGQSLADGLDRLSAAARETNGEGLRHFIDGLLTRMLSGHPQEDDVCVIAARLRDG